jgi:hypothetical protein
MFPIVESTLSPTSTDNTKLRAKGVRRVIQEIVLENSARWDISPRQMVNDFPAAKIDWCSCLMAIQCAFDSVSMKLIWEARRRRFKGWHKEQSPKEGGPAERPTSNVPLESAPDAFPGR